MKKLFLLIFFLPVFLISSPAIKAADDEGWTIEECTVPFEVTVDKPVPINVVLKYSGSAKSVKKKFKFVITQKIDGDKKVTEIIKEVDETEPQSTIKLNLKGPKLSDAGKYTIVVENNDATICMKTVTVTE
jgi:hypothetical protein